MAKTSKGLDEAVMTRMQEIGSAWVFKREEPIQDNKKWSDWKDIKKDPKTFNEIKKVWKTIGKVDWNDAADDEWLESFWQQQKVLISKIGRPAFTEFSRDGGPKGSKYILPGSNSGETFMDWVSKYINKPSGFNIDTKDNWNPADIWLIRNEKQHKDRIMKAMDTPGLDGPGSSC